MEQDKLTRFEKILKKKYSINNSLKHLNSFMSCIDANTVLNLENGKNFIEISEIPIPLQLKITQLLREQLVSDYQDLEKEIQKLLV